MGPNEKDIFARTIQAQNEKLDKIYISVEKTRKYFLWTMIISVVMIVVPLIGLVVIGPLVMNSVLSGVSSLPVMELGGERNAFDMLLRELESL